MYVDTDSNQASRFAIMQYVAMLRRLPEGSVVEKYNNNDAIVVGGVGRIPFPNADAFVQSNQLSFGYTPVSPNAPQSPTQMPTIPKAMPRKEKDLPTALPIEGKLTLSAMSQVLKAHNVSTTECITSNDYAVKLYQLLDRQYDLSADISGASLKVRRALGAPLVPAIEQRIKQKIKSKLSKVDGEPSSMLDAQKKIVKLQDRITDMQQTIERLKKVKGDLVTIQDAARKMRESCAQLKQSSRFQFLDMQDFLVDQTRRFKDLVGSDALRSTGVSTSGTMNAAKKAELEENIKKMKEQNPLRDSASVLKLLLEQTVDDLVAIVKAPLDPSIPIEDSDDEGEGKKKSKKGGDAPRKRRKPNNVVELAEYDKRLPKPELVGKGWTTLAAYDKVGPELDLLKKAQEAVKMGKTMQKIMSNWHLENSAQLATTNNLRNEIESLQRQLTKAQDEAAAAQAAMAELKATIKEPPAKKPADKKAKDVPQSPASPSLAPKKSSTAKDKNQAGEPVTKDAAKAKAETTDLTLTEEDKVPCSPIAKGGEPSLFPSTPASPTARAADSSAFMDDVNTTVAAPVITPVGGTAEANRSPSNENVRPSTAVSETPSLGSILPSAPKLPAIAGSIGESINASASGGSAVSKSNKPPIPSKQAQALTAPPAAAAKTKAPPKKSTANLPKSPSIVPSQPLTPVMTATMADKAFEDEVLQRGNEPEGSEAGLPEEQQHDKAGRLVVGQQLSDETMQLCFAIFTEMSVLGIPRRMFPYIRALFKMLFPNEAPLILQRCVDEEDERIMRQISAPRLQTPPLPVATATASPMAASPMPSLDLPPPVVAQGIAPLSVDQGSGVHARQAANRPDGGVAPAVTVTESPSLGSAVKSVPSPQPSATAVPSVRNDSTVSLGSQPARSLAQPLATTTSLVQAPSVSAPPRVSVDQSTSGSALLTSQKSAVQSDELQMKTPPHGGGLALLQKSPSVVEALPEISAANFLPSMSPLAQIRQLRNKHAVLTKGTKQPTDEERAEEEILFEKRKEKFIELSKKLLADLPVMKRKVGAHPLLDEPTAAGQEATATKPLLFAPSNPLPRR